MRPEYLKQGDSARLFPVLATTSKEGRATSIFLACLARIDEFGKDLLASVGQRVGKRSILETYTEIVFKGSSDPENDRPDGLIIIKNSGREWRALIETKIANNVLDPGQIDRYRTLAKTHRVDCVITISNQFATRPENHPIEMVRRSRSKIPVFHWSWMFILTTADLLLTNNEVADADQFRLLDELRYFLSHESAGVKGFDRMPSEWTGLTRLVSAGGKVSAKSEEARIVLDAWHQKTKDLSLILSRQTETRVIERLSRKHAKDPTLRHKDELLQLREKGHLFTTLEIQGAAAFLEIVADLPRRTVDVGMTIRAPEDKKSSKARVNWLIRQVKGDAPEDLQVRLNWPGRSEATQCSFTDLEADPTIFQSEKQNLQVVSFHIFIARRLGSRFSQQANFISGLEMVVPEFYLNIGQFLTAWRRRPPKIKEERETAADVSVEAIGRQALESQD